MRSIFFYAVLSCGLVPAAQVATGIHVRYAQASFNLYAGVWLVVVVGGGGGDD